MNVTGHMIINISWLLKLVFVVIFTAKYDPYLMKKRNKSDV